MRLRHFHGYGCVSAAKVYRKDYEDGRTMLCVRVEGNHERGLVTGDRQVLLGWLVRRFDRRVTDVRQIANVAYTEGYVTGRDGRHDVDFCTYTFTIDRNVQL